MQLDDFDFALPQALIATRPARPRSSARLLVAGRHQIRDLCVTDLPDVLRPGDRLVLNDTRVIPARLDGLRHRQTGQGIVTARVEVTLTEPLGGGAWSALARPLRKLRARDRIDFAHGLSADVASVADGAAHLSFDTDGEDFDAALSRAGVMPLPPYIAAKRAADAADFEDYQTIWADPAGAVAAPTASLHFDAPLLAALRDRGVATTFVTLHVGAGTFLPVKVADPRDHKMHAERGTVTAQAAAEINATRRAGGRIIPVGTTALRLIETAADRTGTVSAWDGATDIFIYPGYSFRVANALMTNFHLPKSTLMLLVSALMGTARIHDIYGHAIFRAYRFFSYGDASLLLPEEE